MEQQEEEVKELNRQFFANELKLLFISNKN